MMANLRPTESPFVAHPLAPLAASFSCGIVLEHFGKIPFVIVMVASGLAFCLAVIAVRRKKLTVASLFVMVAVFTAGAAGEAATELASSPNRIKNLLDQSAIDFNEPVELTGAIDGPSEPAPVGLYLRLSVQHARYRNVERIASGTVMLLAPVHDAKVSREYELLELRYGARVRVMTRLDRADTFRNPGGSSFTEYLERKGYDATGVIKSPLLIERLDEERVFLPLALLYGWRQSLLTKINRTFSAETAGVLDAALLGNRYFLSRNAAERFRAGGTFHVLVISGLHISFIGGIVFLLMRRLTRRAFVQFIVSVVFLWAYAFAVGAEASVVRAALMFTLIVLAPIVARQAKSLNILGGTALTLVVWQPENLFDPSFQLTFLSVLMIITLGWPLLQRMKAVGSWQPQADTPFPPSCSGWFRNVAESLYWSERSWQREMMRANFSYRLFKNPVAARLERFHLQRPLRFAAAAVVISASVQIGLLPLLVLYFHRVSFASLVLNIGVGVLMAVLALIALVAVVFGQVSAGLSLLFVKLAQSINWFMVHSGDPFIGLGLASARVPEYSGPAAGIYSLYFLPVVALLFLLARWNPLAPPSAGQGKHHFRSKWTIGSLFVIFLALIVFHPLSSGRPTGRLRIDFLDVGQGDAALVTMPDGTTLLIDGGGRPSFAGDLAQTSAEGDEPFTRDTRGIGEAVVSEYLWWRGLDRVDYVLATHADADHIEGLNDVLRNFRVRGAIIARAPDADPEFRQFAETAKTAGVPMEVIGSGDVLHFGNVSAETIWPPQNADADTRSGNNESLVLRFHYGDKTFLLTGDIEKGAESTMLSRGVDLRSDLVKVAHHGSRTSSTESFVDATRASLAIISVGRNSIFGHPHREVVERWRQSGAQVLTTGESGTITVSTDGRDMQVSTFVR